MGKSVKKTFVFNSEWMEVLEDYPPEVRLEVYEAVIRYATSGTLSELRPLAKMAFSFIKKEIDYNNDRYNEIVAKRSEAGKKGMKNRYSNKDNENKSEDKSLSNDNKDNKCNKCYQNVTNVTVNDNVYDNVYVNDNKENTTTVVSKKEAAKAATLARKEDFYQSLVPFVGQYPKEMIRDFFEYWSEMNKSETKMRYEQQPTWEVSKRLATWAKKENGYGKRTYDIERDSEQRKYNSVVAVSTRVQEAAARRLAELKAAGVVKDL